MRVRLEGMICILLIGEIATAQNNPSRWAINKNDCNSWGMDLDRPISLTK
jgi:hypothetical protein